jgi:hypothetical protein
MRSGIIGRIRDGETVAFEGAKVRLLPGKETGDLLEPGDFYLAERNSGPQLLTVKRVRETDAEWAGWVIPVELAYFFDFVECVGVEIVLEENADG